MQKLIINTIIEIPKNSSNKYEYDLNTKTLKLDRVLFGANFYPGEYGFIPETLDWDGDPLDVIALSTYPLIAGCEVAIRILGTIRMIDDGDVDTKLIGVIDQDPRFNHIQNKDDLPPHWIKEVVDFFQNYKNLQEKKVKIDGVGDITEAHHELKTCQKLYVQFKTLIDQNDNKALKDALDVMQKSKS